MNSQNKKSQQLFNYKLKPISLLIFSIFTQQAYAQGELVQDNVSLALSKQLADSFVIESKPSVQNNNKKSVKIVVADASTAVKSKSNTQYKTNTTADASPDVYDVLLGDDSGANVTSNNIPSTADRYGANKELLKTAAVTDAQAQGTGKTDSQGKPISNKSVDIDLKEIKVRAKRFHEIGPLPGLGLTKEEIPGNVQSITAKEIKESHSLSLTDLMNKKLQSVNVNDYQGNPFQMDVTYRGFTAGPQIGTPQGLSVFLDGIRVNEPFGDVVNWDMIPMNAIAGVDVFPGSNPIFGLNTLGGAFTLKTKDGFTNEGVDAEILAGSYGRKQLQVEGGVNNGTFALFGAGNFFLEDGWRQNSPSKVNQFFGKGSYRGEKLDLSLSTLLVQTDLVGNGLLPSEMYAQGRRDVYSSPDTTKNRLAQFQLSGAFQVNDTFSITGQAYRRNSKRHSKGADVFTDYDNEAFEVDPPIDPATGKPEIYTYLFNSSGEAAKLGVMDYVVMSVDVANGEDYFSHPFVTGGYTDLGLVKQNVVLPDGVKAAFIYAFNFGKNPPEYQKYNRAPITIPLGGGDPSPDNFFEGDYYTPFGTIFGSNPIAAPGEVVVNDAGENWYYSKEKNLLGVDTIYKNYIFILPAMNQSNVQALHSGGGGLIPYATTNVDGINHNFLDGIWGALPQTGVVKGTPTAVITDNNINQIVDGASIQFNWNLEHHKFMIGASIDAAEADYSNTSQLGFLDANRKAFLAPDLANLLLGGADLALANNDFNGTNTTKSLYLSETWTPVDTWHFNASARYNETKTKNKIAARYGSGAYSIGDVFNYPDAFNTCPNGDCTNVPTSFRTPRILNALEKAETEKFSYHSFNPSLGATWQAKENLNLFANWAKGTRTPSVIELGCALDKTLVDTVYSNPDGSKQQTYKSIQENRQCTLPTTLSGDPFLNQIRATTYDVGARGTFNSWLGAENLQWNLGAYQTDLKDDIYFISAGNGQGFFDNVGKTRRRGLEAGISGKKDKLSISLNYGLTDATFQDSFIMMSEDNSSSFDSLVNSSGYPLKVIKVKPGDRMPGVPLHNFNASVSYEVTPQWQVGLSAVMHSTSYVRGNENNEHQTGVTQYVQFIDPVNPTNPDGSAHYIKVAKQPTTNPGKVPGYATFNFQTSYKFNQEWTASMLVNNIFDKEYFSAGRLGRNPFSPSINGAIGPDGYNHNSGDWRSTNFIAPSAPRGVWFSVNWQFDPKR
ncbi:MAG: TonB-dependent receptor [Methylophilales bacterium]|nr:TonB-dependent receptor [Methylophilales bacterium]